MGLFDGRVQTSAGSFDVVVFFLFICRFRVLPDVVLLTHNHSNIDHRRRHGFAGQRVTHNPFNIDHRFRGRRPSYPTIHSNIDHRCRPRAARPGFADFLPAIPSTSITGVDSRPEDLCSRAVLGVLFRAPPLLVVNGDRGWSDSGTPDRRRSRLESQACACPVHLRERVPVGLHHRTSRVRAQWGALVQIFPPFKRPRARFSALSASGTGERSPARISMFQAKMTSDGRSMRQFSHMNLPVCGCA